MKSLFMRFVFCFLCVCAKTAYCDIFEEMTKFMSSYFSMDSFFPSYKPKMPDVSTTVAEGHCVMTLDLEGLDPEDDDVHVFVHPAAAANEGPSYVDVLYTQTRHVEGEDARNFHSHFDGFLAPLQIPQESMPSENITMTVTSQAVRSFPLPMECDASSPENSKYAVEQKDKLVVKFPKYAATSDVTKEETKPTVKDTAQPEAPPQLPAPADRGQFEMKRARLVEF